jgi:two-component system sensor histidine kinase YesM
VEDKIILLWDRLSFRLKAFLLLLGSALLCATVALLESPPALARGNALTIAAALLVVALIIVLLCIFVERPLRALENAMTFGVADAETHDGAQENIVRASCALEAEILRLRTMNEVRFKSWMLEKQTELDNLQSQINPHFLYNTLESIRSEALQKGVNEIADMTEALARFFRYSVSLKENTVSLGEELESTRNYFKIQQFRFNNRFSLEISDCDPDILTDCRLPKLSLQPIVENAIFHGLEPKMGAGCIRINIVKIQYGVLIIISDNGLGIDEETLSDLRFKIENDRDEGVQKQSSGGIALPNVHRRIRLTFGPRYGLQITGTLGLGVDVELLIPLGKETE